MTNQPIDMKAVWNGPAGEAWVSEQSLFDQMLKPFEGLIVEGVEKSGKSKILDIGCGAGTTTYSVAKALGEDGRILGVDISEPLLTAAKSAQEELKAEVQFECGDAQEYAFEQGAFNLIISRFGVMFFKDAVAAFSNLKQAVSSEGELLMYVWRSPQENPFMTLSMRAASPYLPEMPKPEPNSPGQFGFADPEYVTSVLTEAGWCDVKLEPVDVACSFPAADLKGYIGIASVFGAALEEKSEPEKAEILDKVHEAYQAHTENGDVKFTAACWKLTAKA